MYLSKPPTPSIKEDYLKILSKISKISEKKLKILEKKLGEDFYMIFNVLSGETISFPSIYKLDEISTSINIIKFINSNQQPLEEKIKSISEETKMSSNKIFQLLNEYELYITE